MSQILLSGGWGYGNLGDDAILQASILLLKRRFPSADIVVMAYDVDSCIADGCLVVPSLHRAVFGTRAFRQLKVWKKSWCYDSLPNPLARIADKVNRLLEPHRRSASSLVQAFMNCPESVDLYRQMFAQSDIFVMSGGGYFNAWSDSFHARILEMQFAQEAAIPTYIIGQTLGPFASDQISVLKKAISSVKGIYVRDEQSKKELEAIGHSCIFAPDLALSSTDCREHENRICIVPAEYPAKAREHFIEAVTTISKRSGCSIILLLTRYYNRDVLCLRDIFERLRTRDVQVEICLPKDYRELDECLARSCYVISRNLHGLILGWRHGAKCLSLNNERKFQGFMQQIGQSRFILNADEATSEEIVCNFEELMRMKTCQPELQQALSKEVIEAFDAIFDNKRDL